jgi:hypothetical protein
MPYEEPTPEELEASREARVMFQQLQRLEMSVLHLQQAAQLRSDGQHPQDAALDALIKVGQAECLTLKSKLSGRIEKRRRPRLGEGVERGSCTVYLDECGAYQISNSVDPFPVFVLAAVIVRDEQLADMEADWKRWKIDNLGGDVVVHEPDVRRKFAPFRGEGAKAIAELPNILGSLDFAALAVVIHRADYFEDFGDGPIDESLPANPYVLSLNFLMERVAFALDRHFAGAKARIVAESRGSKEDALLQHEFSRLHLDGTSYVSSSWFRQQLHPGIEFRLKSENIPGLQLADLLARPVGEKVAAPDTTPPRWESFRDRLCIGTETKNSILGLKVVPWRERYENLWKS